MSWLFAENVSRRPADDQKHRVEPSVSLRSRQWLEKEQHQREELRSDDSQLQSSIPFPALPGERNKVTLSQAHDDIFGKQLYRKTSIKLCFLSCGFYTMTNPLVTHHTSHACTVCKIPKTQVRRNRMLLRSELKLTCVWRGGWLWIIQSVSHRGKLCLDLFVSSGVVKHPRKRTSG